MRVCACMCAHVCVCWLCVRACVCAYLPSHLNQGSDHDKTGIVVGVEAVPVGREEKAENHGLERHTLITHPTEYAEEAVYKYVGAFHVLLLNTIYTCTHTHMRTQTHMHAHTLLCFLLFLFTYALAPSLPFSLSDTYCKNIRTQTHTLHTLYCHDNQVQLPLSHWLEQESPSQPH